MHMPSTETRNNKILLKNNKIILTIKKPRVIFMTIGQDGTGFLPDLSALAIEMTHKEDRR